MFGFFKSEWFKLVLALSILGGIVGLLWYAQYQAKIEQDAYDREKKEHPTASQISLDKYELKEVDDQNRLRWKLTANSGVFEKDNNVRLTGINVQYFDGDVVKMEVVAPRGTANQTEKTVNLESDPKTRVMAKGQEGKSSMETNKLKLTKKNQFEATGGVNIVWSGVAKVTGDRATGSFGKADLEDLKIIGNTHAIIEN